MPKLTQARLKELLHYDPDTGVFTRLVSTNGKDKAGDRAGSNATRGYRAVHVGGFRFKEHRLVWLYMEGFIPIGFEIDHINGITSDNRFINLRLSSRQCNCRNTKLSTNSSSGIKGVSWRKDKKKWRSHITVDTKTIHLGSFKDKTEAVKARWDAEKKYGWPTCNTSSSALKYLKELKK